MRKWKCDFFSYLSNTWGEHEAKEKSSDWFYILLRDFLLVTTQSKNANCVLN